MGIPKNIKTCVHVTYSKYGESWSINGTPHRIDGPAHICHGDYIWYVNGYRIDSWEQFQHESGLSWEEVTILALKWGDHPPTPFVPPHKRKC